MAYDMAVARVAYSTAKGLRATDKILLALFEAGIVESGMRNLNHGDRDSVGFLQQRPSQGWGSREQCMDPRYATTQFVKKAQKLDPDRYATAGQLAQAVQVSAFPLKYDAVKLEATNLLKKVGGSSGFNVPEFGYDDIPDPRGAVQMVDLDNVKKAIATLTNKAVWVRLGIFILGIVALFVGIMKLTGDNKLSETTKTAAKLLVTRKVSK
jgi:hypothetical protein